MLKHRKDHRMERVALEAEASQGRRQRLGQNRDLSSCIFFLGSWSRPICGGCLLACVSSIMHQANVKSEHTGRGVVVKPEKRSC